MTTETIRTADYATDAGRVQHALSRAIAAIASGARAGSDWRRLSAMTDAALAREGLTRDGIARAVLERNFR